MKTFTVAELMNTLTGLLQNKEIKPSMRVCLSTDEEGNNFGTIIQDSFSVIENRLVIFPYTEHIELSEIK